MPNRLSILVPEDSCIIEDDTPPPPSTRRYINSYSSFNFITLKYKSKTKIKFCFRYG